MHTIARKPARASQVHRDLIPPLVGLALYIPSFFLPAIEGSVGYQFALSSILGTVTPLALFCGIINPLLVVYFLLLVADVAVRLRRILIFTILACLPLTWISFLIINTAPAIGHLMWVGGILLVVLPEAQEHLKFGIVQWALAGVLLVGALWGLRTTIFQPLAPPSWNDRFFYSTAAAFNYPGVCSRINSHVYARSARADDDAVVYTLQSKCFLTLATQLGDPNVCADVSPPFLGLDYNTRFTPEDCRMVLTTPSPLDAERRVRELFQQDPTVFIATLNRLGYKDDDVVKWQLRQWQLQKVDHPKEIFTDSYLAFFLWLGSQSNPDHNEFLRRIMTWEPPDVDAAGNYGIAPGS